MKRVHRHAARALALIGMLAVAVRAPAATVPPGAQPGTLAAPVSTPPPNRRVTYAYQTFLAPATVDYFKIRKFGVDYGTATLTFNPDKTVQGTYKPNFSGTERVSGGLTGGGNLWLQIGSRHYTGRFTPLGLALTSTASSPGSGWQLWAHTVRRPAA